MEATVTFFDMPLEELQKYYPERDEPADFDAFWQETLAEAQSVPLNARFEPVDYGLKTVEAYDVTYNGYAGQPVKGWFLIPAQREGKLPCVVHYIGYSGGRGFPTDWLVWPSMGYALLVMDTRGQGSRNSPAATPDVPIHGTSPHVAGFMTQGILHPQTYYYRRVFTDAVRAVEAARSHPAVDAERIVAAGGSQGGGITLAVAGLVPDLAAAMPDVPFLCHYPRAIHISDAAPYSEITSYCQCYRDYAEQAMATLRYFDGVNLATRAKAKALFSTGLMDNTCPPSTVYAAYNYYGGEKDIRVWKYNRHEGGGPFQLREQVAFLKELWG